MAERIEDLIAKWPPEVQSAFLQAIRDHRDSISITRLAALIKAGDVEGAIREVGLDPAVMRRLEASITAAYEASGGQAAAAVTSSRFADGRVLFDFGTFAVEQWRRDLRGQLLGDVMTDTGQMLREQIGQAIARGQNPHDVALDLVGRISKQTGRREAGLIGLSRSQVEWVRSYEADLTGIPRDKALERTLRDARFDRSVQRAITTKEPLPAKKHQAMINAYRNRALKFRAEQIAQAEARKAIGAAQIEAFEQAVQKGAIEADQVVRRWITKGDERVRPEHRRIPGMNPNGVGLHQAFATPEGPCMFPPLGFGCRCLVRMEIRAARVALAA